MLDLAEQVALSFPDYKISRETQQQIIEYLIANSEWRKGTQPGVDEGYGSFGKLQLRKLTQDSWDKISSSESKHVVFQQYRYDPTLNWEWVDTPITDLVKELVNPIEKFFIKLTRVTTLIQHPHESLPLHIDAVPSVHSLFGKTCSIQREINKSWAFKWPLTEVPGDNGTPLIESHGKIFNYKTSDSLFAMRDGDKEHGTVAAPHYRGLIFVDGILNWKRILKEQIEPIEMVEYTGPIERIPRSRPLPFDTK